MNNKKTIKSSSNNQYINIWYLKSNYFAPSIAFLKTLIIKLTTYTVIKQTIKSTISLSKGAKVEFRLLVLDSLKHSGKAESPKNRPAEQSSVGTLPLDNPVFIFLFLYFFMGARLQALPFICITIATDLI